jgi:GDP-L-fucose synthase
VNKNSNIYIAGHNGMVGSAIKKQLEDSQFNNIIVRNKSELDLTDQNSVNSFFKKKSIEYVILAAAKVGGIYANNKYPAEFIYTNLVIQTNVINAAFQNNVKRLLFLGSSCIYPRSVKQPMREDSLLTSVLEPTNEPYAIAKIAGIKLCESFNRQYGTDYRSIMPTNLYGVNDNFHLDNSHVIPGMMARFHDAKINKLPEVIVWGTGKVRREFLFVDDMAEAAIHVLKLDKEVYLKNTLPMLSHVNIGTGSDITISDLALMMKKIVNYDGKIKFDTSRPDGTPQKLLDVNCLKNLGWSYKTELEDGLRETYAWYNLK